MSQLKYIAYCVVVLFFAACKSSLVSIEEYNTARAELVEQDQAFNFSNNIQLSKSEQRLNKKLIELQSAAIKKYKAQHFFPPARNFYNSKAHIEQSELFHLLKMMPKGGALHIHAMAMGDVDWIIDRVAKESNFYIYWKENSDRYVKGQMKSFRDDEVVDGFVDAHALLSDENKKSEFRSFFVFDESLDQDSVDIWKRFEHVFQRINGFVYSEQVFEDYMVHGLALLAADNVQHVELRMPFALEFQSLSSLQQDSPEEKFVASLERILERVRIQYPNFTLKIIHSNLRFRSNETIWADMQVQASLRQKYPDWLTGYDLVAEEDNGKKTYAHIHSFLSLKELNQRNKYSLDLYLHDGESDWVDNDNLYDAVLLGSKRIGHGFNLFRYTSLMKAVKQNDICIEVNPLSNQILGYIRDLRLHPAYTYIRQGVNISISSDDPLIFDYQGLSYDYWSVFMAWQLDLRDLKQLSKNGITYSSMSIIEKERALKIWSNSWDDFVQKSLVYLKKNEHP